MVGFYPLCAFGENRVAASIDTPLHAFLPFAHVDHLHPDWAIALAASANGKAKLEEFNAELRPQDRLGAVAAPRVRAGADAAAAVEDNPGCDGIILGGHGLFTWGETQHDCYSEQPQDHRPDGRVRPGAATRSGRPLFGGARSPPTAPNRERRSPRSCRTCAARCRRTAASSAHYDSRTMRWRSPNSQWAEDLCRLGTSCPDHFLRTRISPMFVPWKPGGRPRALKQRIAERLVHVPRRLREVLQGARASRIRRRCATRIRRSS